MKQTIAPSTVVLATDKPLSQLARLAKQGFSVADFPEALVRFWLDQEDEWLFRRMLNKAIIEGTNAQLLSNLIKSCKFDGHDSHITPDRFSVLDALGEPPFNPIVDRLGHGISTDTARKRLAGKEGTTSQFLRYLRDNEQAGWDLPFVHLASTCVDSDGRRCCLYAKWIGTGRGLYLLRLEHGLDDEVWESFGAEELGA